MATYTKTLKTVEVHLIGSEDSMTLSDTNTDNSASMALAQFKQHKDATAKAFGIEVTIPYHAIDYIKVTETEAEVEKADPYGCE